MKFFIIFSLLIFLPSCIQKKNPDFGEHIPEVKIVETNLIKNDNCTVTSMQDRFLFAFTGPIKLEGDIKFRVQNAQGQSFIHSPDFFKLSDDKIYLELKFNDLYAKSNINILDTFFVQLEGISNLKTTKLSKKLECMLLSPDAPLKQISKPIIKVSSRSARIILPFNNQVTWQVFLGKAENEKKIISKENILFDKCRTNVISICEIHMNNLEQNTRYYFQAISQDYQSEFKNIEGHFTTTQEKSLRISELMIIPKSEEGVPESKAEYIKLTNTSNETMFIDSLKLSVMSVNNRRKTSWFVLDNINKELAPNGNLFIVGKNFDPSIYSFNERDLIVKGNKISLGFSNKNKKIVTIWHNYDEYFDEYHPFLWESHNGNAVKRKNLLGIDEKQNYCYSSL